MSVHDIEAGLESGLLDLGISFFPAGRPMVEGEKWFTEELVAVVPVNHAWAKRRSINVAELANQPLVLLSSQYCTRQLAEGAFTQARIRPRVQVEMNSVESILSTVRRGRLISVLPTLALCQRDTGVIAIPLTKPTPRRAIGLLWMRGADRRAAAHAFASITNKVLAERGLNRAD
jgi:LysR family cyn operon transcriptional activator